jgi:hypothetical protein
VIASMIGVGPHDMSGWAWFLMALITLMWLVAAVAAVVIAVAVTRDRERDRGSRA